MPLPRALRASPVLGARARPLPGRRSAVRIRSDAAHRGDERDAVCQAASLAPLAPSSTAGKRLHWCLAHASRLPDFDTLVNAHMEVVAADAEAERAAAALHPLRSPPMAPADASLRLRLLEIRRQQRAAATQDMLYALALRRFVAAGVQLSAPLVVSSATASTSGAGAGVAAAQLDAAESAHVELLLALHRPEAAQVVRAHVTASVDSGKALRDGDVVRCAAAQAAQAYYCALLFGYFIRAIDFRYALDQQLRTLPLAPGHPAAEAPDASPLAGWPQSLLRGVTKKSAAASAKEQCAAQIAFGAYIDSFREGELLGSLLEGGLTAACKDLMLRHTSALFGNVTQLHAQFMVRSLRRCHMHHQFLTFRAQAAHGVSILQLDGTDEAAAAAAAARVRDDVEHGRLETLRLPVNAVRRLVAEAAALGAMLRDAEARAHSYGLLQ